MFNAGMLNHMSQQQQQLALLQMAQLQMAQMGNYQKSNQPQQPLSMMIPGAGQFVLVPQAQLHQIQQLQDAQIRHQIHQQHDSDGDLPQNFKSFSNPAQGHNISRSSKSNQKNGNAQKSINSPQIAPPKIKKNKQKNNGNGALSRFRATYKGPSAM